MRKSMGGFHQAWAYHVTDCPTSGIHKTCPVHFPILRTTGPSAAAGAEQQLPPSLSPPPPFGELLCCIAPSQHLEQHHHHQQQLPYGHGQSSGNQTAGSPFPRSPQLPNQASSEGSVTGGGPAQQPTIAGDSAQPLPQLPWLHAVAWAQGGEALLVAAHDSTVHVCGLEHMLAARADAPGPVEGPFGRRIQVGGLLWKEGHVLWVEVQLRDHEGICIPYLCAVPNCTLSIPSHKPSMLEV